jgi:protein involved in polysaccharide export with SLBB domain
VRAADGRVLLPGDRIEIFSGDEPTLCVVRTVSIQGLVSVPSVGLVPVGNLTLEEAAQRITDALVGTRQSHREPVRLRGLPPREQTAIVTGAVAQAGKFWLGTEDRLLELVQKAAPTDVASLASVRVSHFDGTWGTFDLTQNQNPRVLPGDRVGIALQSGQSNVVVVGGVRWPGVVRWRPGITLGDAIAEVDGLNPHGRADAIVLTRSGSDLPPLSLDRDRAYALRPGDSVRVTLVDRPLFVSVLGPVVQPGLVPFKDGMRLTEVIKSAGGIRAAYQVDIVVVSSVVNAKRTVKRYSLAKIARRELADPVILAQDSVEVYPVGYGGGQ